MNAQRLAYEQRQATTTGMQSPSNIGELDTLCAASRNPWQTCLRVPGADHFSVLRPATRVIAARLATPPDGRALKFSADELIP